MYRVVHWMSTSQVNWFSFLLGQQGQDRHEIDLLDYVEKCWYETFAVDHERNELALVIFGGSCSSAVEQIESNAYK